MTVNKVASPLKEDLNGATAQPLLMIQLFEPGVYVRHPAEPDWGIGQVQSAIGSRVTVNFEHAGKRLIDTRTIALEFAKPEQN